MMRNLRLLAVSAVLATGALAAATIPAFATTAICIKDNGTIYKVNADGISVRNPPGGAVVQGIQQNRFWDDAWVFSNISGVYTCTTAGEVNGQFWMPGVANFNPNLQGWIGADYLDYVQAFQ
jgi:hypothetical protein